MHVHESGVAVRPRALLPADVWGSCLVAELQLTRATPALLHDRARMPSRWRPVIVVRGLPTTATSKPVMAGRVA